MLRSKNGFSVFQDLVASITTLLGVVSCAIVDLDSGTCLACAGNDKTDYLGTAGMVNARLLRTEIQMVSDQHREAIEDVIITLGHQYHLIHLIRCNSNDSYVFAYLVLDRNIANIVMVRRKLREMAGTLNADLTAVQQAEKENFDILHLPNGLDRVDDYSQVCSDDELPPFMRDDVALMLLGINEDGDDIA